MISFFPFPGNLTAQLDSTKQKGLDMATNEKGCSRRTFLKSMGATGVGALIGTANGLPVAYADSGQLYRVPTRAFGKTGDKVSILALGGNGTSLSQLIMHQAVKWGVTFWDGWDSDRPFGGGISHKSIGKYFKKFPNDRKKVFLMTKAGDRKPKALTKFLNKSLLDMNTDTLDFFVFHSVSSIKSIHSDIRVWADKARAAGKIRYFGVSSHQRMEEVMEGAVELGWLDGVMITYNYRVMHIESMKKAVEKCQKAGLAIVAMKTQGTSVSPIWLYGNKTAMNLTDSFIQKGFTPAQATLKAVWTNPHISSLTSMMLNMNHFSANVAAALDKTTLSDTDVGLLKKYARETRSFYCAGCTQICQSTLDKEVPIGEVMRYLMYARAYGDQDRGRALFSSLPEQTRTDIVSLDYSFAEKRCPQKIAIGKLMCTAVKELGC
jgi:predicted aldo/keto reductase-like oxidoreductase